MHCLEAQILQIEYIFLSVFDMLHSDLVCDSIGSCNMIFWIFDNVNPCYCEHRRIIIWWGNNNPCGHNAQRWVSCLVRNACSMNFFNFNLQLAKAPTHQLTSWGCKVMNYSNLLWYLWAENWTHLKYGIIEKIEIRKANNSSRSDPFFFAALVNTGNQLVSVFLISCGLDWI